VAFDAWLLRGGTRRAVLRRWFADLVEDGVITPVTVHDDLPGPGAGPAGEQRYARVADLEELAADPGPALDEVHLLPAFDQWVLGPGTGATAVLAPEHRPAVSRTAGWIAPVVVHGGRVVGTWDPDDPDADPTWFDGERTPSPEALAAARARRDTPPS
jgi:hypothetical protein